MANRLADETSPYLLQHKDNPVDWYPWGAEAFEKARAEDKPILLSVGYSACHWCHVMEHESFEDPDVARLMNELYVNIKVDREERPDVDAIYMQAVQALTGRGGWPMTVFLTPDGRPFYGGTYYPPEDRHGLPSFSRVLTSIAQVYRANRGDVEKAAGQIQSQLSAVETIRPGNDLLTEDILHVAYGAIAQSHDRVNGGFGSAPKFPQPMTLDFLLRYHHRTKSPGALEIVERTLRRMALGGMYDQVGGGFHRYATDAVWLVPHFEKMLYDNALLARVYLDAYRVTGLGFYRRVSTETLDYVLREMTHPDGGFYSTQDADSEGAEGKFFVWTPEEIAAALEDDAEIIARYFGVTDEGNFEGRNILHVPVPAEEFAALHGMEEQDFDEVLRRAKAKLYEARERRVHPGRDEKVLTAWNGMMMRSLAEAGALLGSERYLEAAARNADFILANLFEDGRLLRSWKDGRAKLRGYLEDYALLIDGLLATYEATFELRYLRRALELADDMVRLFWDDGVQGFFDTATDHETLIARPRDFFDNATPSGTSVAADVMLRIAVLTGDTDRERRAVACLRALAPVVQRAPSGFGRLLTALDFHLRPIREVAVIWPERPEQARPILDVLRESYRPDVVLAGAREGEGGDLTPLLEGRVAAGGQATAYVCERFVCQAPATDPDALRRLLNGET
ncbi:MAG TPA: thioredoxin domain-containing protein [Dehalococcoidia bacterium]|nr:thioredoxin domain-containing protein [Dehalococcoidia bacterium]